MTGVTGIESWIGPVTPGPLLRHTLIGTFLLQSHLSPLSRPENPADPKESTIFGHVGLTCRTNLIAA